MSKKLYAGKYTADEYIEKLKEEVVKQGDFFREAHREIADEAIKLKDLLKEAEKVIDDSCRHRLHYLGDISGTSYGWIEYVKLKEYKEKYKAR